MLEAGEKDGVVDEHRHDELCARLVSLLGDVPHEGKGLRGGGKDEFLARAQIQADANRNLRKPV